MDPITPPPPFFTEQDLLVDTTAFMHESTMVSPWTSLQSLPLSPSILSLLEPYQTHCRWVEIAHSLLNHAQDMFHESMHKDREEGENWSLCHSLSVSSPLLSLSIPSEAEQRQLKKDIERDQVLLNGELLLGATEKVEGILSRLQSLCLSLFESLSLSSLCPTPTS